MHVMHFLPFKTIKTLKLWMDHAKLLDVLTSLPVSQSILPRAVCFATLRLANNAISSFIDSSRYASGPIRRCLFIDYIIITVITWTNPFIDHIYQMNSSICNILAKLTISSHRLVHLYFRRIDS